MVGYEECSSLAIGQQGQTGPIMRRLTCDAVTPLKETIIRFASVSVAPTKSQFSLNSSTNSVRDSAACCSDRTARILEARALASSQAEERTSDKSREGTAVGLAVDGGVGSGKNEEIDMGFSKLYVLSVRALGEHSLAYPTSWRISANSLPTCWASWSRLSMEACIWVQRRRKRG